MVGGDFVGAFSRFRLLDWLVTWDEFAPILPVLWRIGQDIAKPVFPPIRFDALVGPAAAKSYSARRNEADKSACGRCLDDRAAGSSNRPRADCRNYTIQYRGMMIGLWVGFIRCQADCPDAIGGAEICSRRLRRRVRRALSTEGLSDKEALHGATLD